MNAEVFKNKELWLVTGSQHLYGPVALEQVGANSRQVAAALDGAEAIPVKVVFKTVATTPEEIRAVCSEANSAAVCVGLIFWCHTFSPAKMWIGGLSILNKPFVHLHTQFNQDLPFGTIDMDFMNLNQAAHGDREFGFIHTRMRLERKVVVGHWSDTEVQERIGSWTRAAVAWNDWQGARLVRFGDNMRYVAVTCGDKVSAEATFGFSVNTHGVGDLVERMNAVSELEIDALVDEYQAHYGVVPDLARGGARHDALRYEARLELGIGGFLEDGGFCGFTDTFEDLHGIQQLPGMASQRLMAKGYGFGAEGDWKHSALLRAMKVMSAGLPGGTSFMEDYTYHMNPAQPLVLGAHMLEICPSIADGQPRCEIHPLGIGGKADPVRLVFDARQGPALNASLVDLGNRFRLVVNEVEAVTPEAMPKLPVARALWKPKPDFKTALASWIYAGGAHHTGYSYSVTTEMLEDFAAMAGIEFVLIDGQTSLRELRTELRSNEVYYHSAKGFSFA